MSVQVLNRTIAHPLPRVFAVFTDLSAYPAVVRLVRAADILDRTPSAIPDTETVRFALKVGYGLISTRFSGRALVNRADHAVIIAQETGPFDAFKAKLQFQAIDADRTRLVMSSEWSFASSGVGGLIGGLLDGRGETLQRRLVAAFVRHLDAAAPPAA